MKKLPKDSFSHLLNELEEENRSLRENISALIVENERLKRRSYRPKCFYSHRISQPIVPHNQIPADKRPFPVRLGEGFKIARENEEE